MSDIFLSYASEDRDRVQPLVRVLEQQGYSVWWDKKIPIGKTFDEVIEEAIESAKCVIVVWTQSSIKSRWVRTEASEGDDRNVLIPVLIDDVKIPLAYRLIETAQLIDWDGSAKHTELEVMLDAVTRIMSRQQTARRDRTERAVDLQRSELTRPSTPEAGPPTGENADPALVGQIDQMFEEEIEANKKENCQPESVIDDPENLEGEMLHQLDQIFAQGEQVEAKDVIISDDPNDEILVSVNFFL